MHIQVMTFRANGMSEADIQRHNEFVRLGIHEFPGLVSANCLSQPKTGLFGGVAVWESRQALERFRHSELYARLMLCPYLDDAFDRDYEPGAEVRPIQEDGLPELDTVYAL